MSAKASLAGLPRDVALSLLALLSPDSRACVAATCKPLREAAGDDSLWSTLALGGVAQHRRTRECLRAVLAQAGSRLRVLDLRKATFIMGNRRSYRWMSLQDVARDVCACRSAAAAILELLADHNVACEALFLFAKGCPRLRVVNAPIVWVHDCEHAAVVLAQLLLRKAALNVRPEAGPTARTHAAALFDALAGPRQAGAVITRLHVECVELTGAEQGAALGRAVAAHAADWESLELFTTRLGDDGVAALAAALSGGRPQQAAAAAGGGGGGDGGAGAAGGAAGEGAGGGGAAAAPVVAAQLTELSLQGGEVTDAGCTALASALGGPHPAAPALTTLQLGDNWVEDGGAVALAAALPSCPQLASVDLWLNCVDDAGAAALAAAAAAHPALARLSLGGQGALGDAAAAAFAAAVAAQTASGAGALASLGLDRGTVGPAGCAALARAAAASRTLTRLDLSLNPVGDAGAAALAAALRPPPRAPGAPPPPAAGAGGAPPAPPASPLRELVLALCRIRSAGVAALAAALATPGCGLTHLDLRHNALGAAGCDALAAALGPPPAAAGRTPSAAAAAATAAAPNASLALLTLSDGGPYAWPGAVRDVRRLRRVASLRRPPGQAALEVVVTNRVRLPPPPPGLAPGESYTIMTHDWPRGEYAFCNAQTDWERRMGIDGE